MAAAHPAPVIGAKMSIISHVHRMWRSLSVDIGDYYIKAIYKWKYPLSSKYIMTPQNP